MTSQKRLLPDGTYCHKGPGCRRHPDNATPTQLNANLEKRLNDIDSNVAVTREPKPFDFNILNEDHTEEIGAALQQAYNQPSFRGLNTKLNLIINKPLTKTYTAETKLGELTTAILKEHNTGVEADQLKITAKAERTAKSVMNASLSKDFTNFIPNKENGYKGFWVHGSPARDASQVFQYSQGDAHDQSKIQWLNTDTKRYEDVENFDQFVKNKQAEDLYSVLNKAGIAPTAKWEQQEMVAALANDKNQEYWFRGEKGPFKFIRSGGYFGNQWELISQTRDAPKTPRAKSLNYAQNKIAQGYEFWATQ